MIVEAAVFIFVKNVRNGLEKPDCPSKNRLPVLRSTKYEANVQKIQSNHLHIPNDNKITSHNS